MKSTGIGNFASSAGGRLRSCTMRSRTCSRKDTGAISAICQSDAGVRGGEMRELLPPGKVIAAEAVREDERRTFAHDFVVNLGVAAPQPPGTPHFLSSALRVQCFAFTAPFGALPFAIAAACATVPIDWCSIAGTVRPALCGVA